MQVEVVPVTPFEQNCSILICKQTNKAAIVDPGGDSDLILGKLETLGVWVELILITHGHLDHCGHAAKLKKKLNVRIEGPHQADNFWILQLPQQGAQFGMGNLETFEPDRWLNQGDTVSFGKVRLDVFHCPGHTPGHIVFFEPKNKIAIVGDVLFKGSIGRTDFPRGDYNSLIDSITKVLWPLGEEITFLPGHGPTSTFKEERKSNPFVSDRILRTNKK